MLQVVALPGGAAGLGVAFSDLVRTSLVVFVCLILLGCGEDARQAELVEAPEAVGFTPSAEPVECLPLDLSCREVEVARGYRCIDSHSAGADALLDRSLRSGGTRSATACDSKGAECGCRVKTAITRACRVVWTFKASPDPEVCRANCEAIGGDVLPPKM